ncbi:MAG: IS21 family transposase [Candidatus Zophobacter franzmannii]|nr:IS21 family transposase [Candidatus Zophobacter franzmannii]
MEVEIGTTWQLKLVQAKSNCFLIISSTTNGANMIGVMMYHSILSLQASGKSQREIADLLDISKTTVNVYCNLPLDEGEHHSCQRVGKSSFDVAKDYLVNRLSLKPKLRSSRLFLEVIKKYPEIKSKERAFRTYVRALREHLPTESRRCFGIIETDSGKQIQVDPGEMKVDFSSNRRVKVYFVSFVLSYSRQLFVHFQFRHYKTADFIEAHRQAFIYFEGIPQECVYDQTKLVVIQEKYREVILNEEFHQFSLKTGFLPSVCEGYDPQSKGKVERTVREVKEGFLYGRTFEDLQDIQAKGYQWLAHFNSRVHATTQKIPVEVWNEEKALLKPIPASLVKPACRKADKTGLISFCGNRYSVPLIYQERQVVVDEESGMLIVTDPITCEFICTHKLGLRKGEIIKNNNHYRDYEVVLADLNIEVTELLSTYVGGANLVQRIVKENPKEARDQLRALRKFFNKYEQEIWQEALVDINSLGHVKATSVEKILNTVERTRRLANISLDEPVPNNAGSVIQRSLEDYMKVLNHD